MRFRTIPGALAAVALIAGLRSSSQSSTQSPSQAANTSASTTSAATTSTPAATSASAGAPTFASTGNCQQLATMAATYLKAVEPASGGGKLDLGAFLKADQALADASPPAIHSDAELVVHGFAGYIGTLGKLGYTPGSAPTPAQIAGIAAPAQQFNQPRFHAATNHVSLWIHQNCEGVTP